jgi:hypothetical protein
MRKSTLLQHSLAPVLVSGLSAACSGGSGDGGSRTDGGNVGGDGGGGGGGGTAAEGIYQLTSWTENTASCDAEGASIADDNSTLEHAARSLRMMRSTFPDLLSRKELIAKVGRVPATSLAGKNPVAAKSLKTASRECYSCLRKASFERTAEETKNTAGVHKDDTLTKAARVTRKLLCDAIEGLSRVNRV